MLYVTWLSMLADSEHCAKVLQQKLGLITYLNFLFLHVGHEVCNNGLLIC